MTNVFALRYVDMQLQMHKFEIQNLNEGHMEIGSVIQIY